MITLLIISGIGRYCSIEPLGLFFLTCMADHSLSANGQSQNQTNAERNRAFVFVLKISDFRSATPVESSTHGIPAGLTGSKSLVLSSLPATNVRLTVNRLRRSHRQSFRFKRAGFPFCDNGLSNLPVTHKFTCKFLDEPMAHQAIRHARTTTAIDCVVLIRVLL